MIVKQALVLGMDVAHMSIVANESPMIPCQYKVRKLAPKVFAKGYNCPPALFIKFWNQCCKRALRLWVFANDAPVNELFAAGFVSQEQLKHLAIIDKRWKG
eukprot:6492082-Amphidinium_carterae.3